MSLRKANHPREGERDQDAVLQLENIPWCGKNILSGGKRAFEGTKIY